MLTKEKLIKEILNESNPAMQTDSFLCKSVSRAMTSKGKPYLTITLQDSSGETVAKYWDPTEEQLTTITSGVFVECVFSVGIYNDTPQITIKSVTKVGTTEDVDVGQYILKTEHDITQLKSDIKNAIYAIQNDTLRKIVFEVFKDAGKKFFEHPAAKSVHHSFYGGLAQHTYEMLQLADKVCEVFPDLNRDLLVSGVLLHDIAKTVELSGPIGTDYTTTGKLLGHITMVQAYVYVIAKSLNLHHTEECMLLQHMVISHHGQLEYGSPVKPCIKEAMVLNQIDGISAKYNTFTNALKDVNEGEWSAYVPALEGAAYKPMLHNDAASTSKGDQ